VKPCCRCGDPLPPGIGRGRRTCDKCKKVKVQRESRRTKCEREGCNELKKPGRGNKLCEFHSAESQQRFAQQRGKVKQYPCRQCGGTENKQKGKQYCDPCREWVRDVKKIARRARRAARERKVCAGCFKPKGPGYRRRYCDACYKAREEAKKAPRKCNVCGENKVTEKYKKACADCRQKSHERHLARQRAYQKRLRENPETAEKLREKQRKAKRANRERENESKRMQYRLREMRKGRTLAPVKEDKRTSAGPRVPAAPLKPLIEQWVRVWEAEHVTHRRKETGALKAFAEQAELPERRVWGIMHDEYEKVTLTTADAICVAVGIPYTVVYADAA
jgi:hypothetical protein